MFELCIVIYYLLTYTNDTSHMGLPWHEEDILLILDQSVKDQDQSFESWICCCLGICPFKKLRLFLLRNNNFYNKIISI